ncbi:hypothetical protein [Cognatiyoonia sp. IB215182]|uniref:hypothetical protein n=1 Tax=Cognatiyoonia sp. IB215182 TaxID=3097353 RepID=UPI002A0AECC5|nr:hypothetical protein [Cognatiyoonia sp. IB215182]MDX8353298.1 hypothetical protein [Cognatiyoonia sp. IB215182]
MKPLKVIALPAILGLVTACAAPSVQHAAQSADHSAQATSHGVSAAATSAATVTAVPVVAAGSVLSVTGAALEEVGEGAVVAGVEVLDATLGHAPTHTCPTGTVAPQRACPTPDGPPRLR